MTIGWIIFIFILCISAFFVNVWIPLSEERDHLKMQIMYSETKEERTHFKRELRRLYLSYVPIVRWFVIRERR